MRPRAVHGKDRHHGSKSQRESAPHREDPQRRITVDTVVEHELAHRDHGEDDTLRHQRSHKDTRRFREPAALIGLAEKGDREVNAHVDRHDPG